MTTKDKTAKSKSQTTDSKAALPAAFGLQYKGALLMVVPVCLQMLLLSLLVICTHDIDQEDVKVGLMRERAQCMRTYLMQSNYVMLIVDRAVLHKQAVDKNSRDYLDKVSLSGEKIKSFWRQDPAVIKQVDGIQRGLSSICQDANHAFVVSAQAQKRGTAITPRDSQYIAGKYKTIREQQKGITNRLDILRDSKLNPVLLPRPGAQDSRRLFFQITCGATFINVVVLLIAAWIYNRDVVKRLGRSRDNIARFARGQRLTSASALSELSKQQGDSDELTLGKLAAGDEISQLDQNFYEMATRVKIAEDNQQQLYQHVNSVLCQVDKLGRFEEVNSAARAVFGQKPEALTGKYVEDLVPVDDRKLAIERITKAISDGRQPPFELPIIKPDGSVVQTLWTARFVPERDRVFCVVQDATERIAAERVKKQVLQMVSHDLRSPLASITLVYKLIESGHLVTLNAKGATELTAARADAERMLTLVSNLLDIEKMEAGMLALELETFDITTVIGRAIKAVSASGSQVETRGLSILSKVPATSVMADKFRLEQILVHLLSNAARVSPLYGQITIFTRAGNGYLRVIVSDKGPGIAPNMQKSIFNFRASGGNGMGLSICRALVHLHGGEIAVECPPGGGSNFYFSLPDNTYRSV